MMKIEICVVLMRESRTWTTQEMADQIGISYGSTHNLLVEMDYRKVGSHWLPHELSGIVHNRPGVRSLSYFICRCVLMRIAYL